MDFIDGKEKAKTKSHHRRRHRHKLERSKTIHSEIQISRKGIKNKIKYSYSNADDDNLDPQQTVFDFLNVSLNKGKHGNNSNLAEVNNTSASLLQNNSKSSSNNNRSAERPYKNSSETNQLQLYHIQNQLNQKSQELQKAKESLKRNEKKDPTMANHFREKINEIEATYQILKRKEQEIQHGLDRAKGRKKMIVF